MVNVGIVGYGYWGPNLARNFAGHPECDLAVICDLSEERRKAAIRQHPYTPTTDNYAELIANPHIHAIAIATPAETHYKLAKQAIMAGKDVLVEKPFTTNVAHAEALVELGAMFERIVAVDHIFLYADPVQRIKAMIDDGTIGDLLYIDSVRTNLGLFQRDHNVIYDLAPHEFSIVQYLVGRAPRTVRAMGACHAPNGQENLAYIHLDYGADLVAHFHLNWLAPVKLRQTIIAGSKKMIVYDDMERGEKLKVYDKGIDIPAENNLDAMYQARINYRTGDMVAPHLDQREPLAVEVDEFIKAVQTRQAPLADAVSGLQVMRLIEAAQESLRCGGEPIALHGPASTALRRYAA